MLIAARTPHLDYYFIVTKDHNILFTVFENYFGLSTLYNPFLPPAVHMTTLWPKHSSERSKLRKLLVVNTKPKRN